MALSLSDFPLIYEIRDEYFSLRKNGLDREKTVKQLTDYYCDEVNDFDDRNSFWIGICLAQSFWKELTEDAAENVHSAVEYLKDIGLKQSDVKNIRNRIEKPENFGEPKNRKDKKPAPLGGWQLNDVYLYRLKSEDSEYDGQAILMHVTGFCTLKRVICPMVCCYIWNGSDFPKNAKEVISGGAVFTPAYYSVCGGDFRCFTRVIDLKKSEFKAVQEKFFHMGNFADIPILESDNFNNAVGNFLRADMDDRIICDIKNEGIYHVPEDYISGSGVRYTKEMFLNMLERRKRAD